MRDLPSQNCEAVKLLHSRSLATRAAELAGLVGVEPAIVDVEGSGDSGRVALLEQDHREDIEEALGRIDSDEGALVVYTSGTTGKPKGALHTHGSLEYQMRSMTEAWRWRESDKILHCLPLHHIHGIVNALYCPHFNSAHVKFLGSPFSPERVWESLAEDDEISVFMGVPTMYAYLLSHLEGLSSSEPGERGNDHAEYARAAEKLRLTVSGSSACPVTVMERWEDISGGVLLERYGMSETGMILSNPYKTQERLVGTVGKPMPYVEVETSEEGELLVKSKCMMKGYYGMPEETEAAFVQLGHKGLYFKTGDCVELNEDSGVYTVKGRMSADIIKHKGYKVSALDVENVLLSHGGIKECAVVGVDHDLFGQAIVAVVVKVARASKSGSLDTLADLRAFCKDHLADYQIPQRVEFVDEIPRNAMGKVNKKELASKLL